jgi:hypothetical protein
LKLRADERRETKRIQLQAYFIMMKKEMRPERLEFTNVLELYK